MMLYSPRTGMIILILTLLSISTRLLELCHNHEGFSLVQDLFLDPVLGPPISLLLDGDICSLLHCEGEWVWYHCIAKVSLTLLHCEGECPRWDFWMREAQGQSWCCTALVFSMLSATFALLIKHCRQAIRVEQTVTKNDPYSVGAMAILKNSMAARTAAVIIANNNGNSNHNYDYTISEETACSTKHAARRQMKNESMISQVRATR